MKDGILTFARAIFWGTFAGGVPFLPLTFPILFYGRPSWSEFGSVIYVALLPLIVAGAVVTTAALFLGLPLTALLAHMRCENRTTYVWAGGSLGAILPICLALFPDGGPGIAYFAVPGAIAGAVTGAVWGRWRQDVASPPSEPAEPSQD